MNYYPITNRIDPRIKIIDLNIKRKIDLLNDIYTIAQLLNIFRNNKFISVHCITPKAVLLGSLVSFICRIPIRIISFSGQVWATKSGFKRNVLKRADRSAIALANRYISDSQSQIDFLRSEGVLHDQQVHVFGQGSIAGVDLERFKPSPDVYRQKRLAVGFTENDFIYLFVGRITREKGIFDLLAAFEALRNKNPTVKLWIVGPDEEGIIADFLKQDVGLPEGVEWFGATETPEEYMQAADVLVLPSYRESFGVVIIEAAACGVPSIAYNIVGVKDAIMQDETGIMVGLYDIENLTKAMFTLFDNKNLRETMKIKGIQRIEQYFKSADIVKKWVQYYENNIL